MSVIQISITPSTVFSTIISTIVATPTPSLVTQAPGYLQDTNIINTFVGEVIFAIVIAITAAVFICKNRSYKTKLIALRKEFKDQQIVNQVQALRETTV